MLPVLVAGCQRRAAPVEDVAPAAPAAHAAPSHAAAPPPTPLSGDAAIAAKICAGNMTDLPASLFGHQKFADGPAGLVAAPAGFNMSHCPAMQGDMASGLAAMLRAARAESPAIADAIGGVSCYRGIAYQRGLYCQSPNLQLRGYAGQAYWVAPPGYSEHATGRAIDFGDRSRTDCNVSPCFAATAVGRWLSANAARFGFRLSFPKDNAAGVAHEPWHYYYVGGYVAPPPTSGGDAANANAAPITPAPSTPATSTPAPDASAPDTADSPPPAEPPPSDATAPQI
ncbi:MAG: M15 family metallopeptidase [Sphingomonadaceae bacterium]|nr:M15 family metallopeptidase [Sphingomonadaceae bacterium]